MSAKLRLLAPVPCIHLQSALQLSGPRVAFGSDAPVVFDGLPMRTPVLIYASLPEAGGAHLYVKARATFAATFVLWSQPDPTGKHLFPDERPETTRDDTPFAGFWVVENFRRLEPREWVSMTQLKLPGVEAALNITHPQGPMKVEMI